MGNNSQTIVTISPRITIIEKQAGAVLCQAQVKMWLATVEIAFIKDKI